MLINITINSVCIIFKCNLYTKKYRYIGEFKNNMKHGKGKYTHTANDKFKGYIYIGGEWCHSKGCKFLAPKKGLRANPLGHCCKKCSDKPGSHDGNCLEEEFFISPS